MLIFNTSAKLQLIAGRDLYGQPKHADPVTVPCAVVSLHRTTVKTGVRTDATATRGAAEEQKEQAMILFPPNSGVVQDARVTLMGFELRVTDVQPRLDINGHIDHLECLLSLWAEPGGAP